MQADSPRARSPSSTLTSKGPSTTLNRFPQRICVRFNPRENHGWFGGFKIGVSMSITFHTMTIADYPQVLELWRSVEGMGLGESDSEEAIGAYLARNPNMSFVVRARERVIAAVLCGHDGRRGFIHHLAVHPDHRRKGFGRALVERCLQELEAAGILKCHIFIYRDNKPARAFWRSIGWAERIELTLMSRDLPSDPR